MRLDHLGVSSNHRPLPQLRICKISRLSFGKRLRRPARGPLFPPAAHADNDKAGGRGRKQDTAIYSRSWGGLLHHPLP